MKICFLDNTKFKYSYLDKHSPLLRGAETILINLTENLKMLGHEVTVFNNCSDDIDNNSSNWFNINKVNKQMSFDVAVANADMRLLDTITAAKKFTISYSLQSIEKFLRKGQLISYFKNKPTILLIGKYHMRNRSKLLSLFGSKIIDIAIDDLFLNTKLTNNIDSNMAIFTSRPDRNLDILIKIWSENILPNFKNAKLLTTPTETISQSSNVIFRKMDSQENLIEIFKNETKQKIVYKATENQNIDALHQTIHKSGFFLNRKKIQKIEYLKYFFNKKLTNRI